jgi:cold shock CspA family protein
MRGKMIWFNEVKDHGFIMTDEGERLAVAGSGFAPGERPEGRCAQMLVTFEVDDTNGTRQAENVIFPQEAAAHRPRLRRGYRGGS